VISVTDPYGRILGFLGQKAVPMLNLIKLYAVKVYGGVEVYIHHLLVSALVEGVTSLKPSPFFPPPPEHPGKGGWGGPRAKMGARPT
jgi:hypothetical protein